MLVYKETSQKPITEEDYLFLFSQPVPKQLISLL